MVDDNRLESELQVPPELNVSQEGSQVLSYGTASSSLSSSWVLLPEDDEEEEQQGDKAASPSRAPCTIDDDTTSDACISDAPDGDLSTSVLLDAMADECQTGSDIQQEEDSTTAFAAAPPLPVPESPLVKPAPVALDAPPAAADAKVSKDIGVEACLDEPNATVADCGSDKGAARRHAWERRVLLAVLLLSTHAAVLCIGVAIGSRTGGGSEASCSLLTRRYSSGPYNSSTPWLSLASSSHLCRS